MLGFGICGWTVGGGWMVCRFEVVKWVVGGWMAGGCTKLNKPCLRDCYAHSNILHQLLTILSLQILDNIYIGLRHHQRGKHVYMDLAKINKHYSKKIRFLIYNLKYTCFTGRELE